MKDNTNERKNTAVLAQNRRKNAVAVLRTPWMKRILTAVLTFAFAFLVAGTAAFPRTYPFGIAYTASASGMTAVLSAMAGAMLGSVRIRPFGAAYALILAALTTARLLLSHYLTASTDGTADKEKKKPASWRQRLFAMAVGGTMLREHIRVRIVLSAAAALAAGAYTVAAGGFSYYDLFGAVFSLLIAPLLTAVFYAARERKMRDSPYREVAVYIAAASLTLACATLSRGGMDTLFERTAGRFDCGVLCAFTVTVVLSMACGMHRGALLGLCCGMTMQAAYAPGYAVAAVVTGTLGSLSPTLALLGGSAAVTAWAVYTGGFPAFAVHFPPVLVASAVLIPLYRHGFVRVPDSLFGTSLAVGRTRRTEDAMAAVTASNMKRRLGALSEGMLSVSAVLGGLSERLTRPGRADYAEITETTFETYCRGCKLREKCHGGGRDPDRLAPVMGKMVEELTRDGVVTAGVIPSALASTCWNMGRILDEINGAVGRRIAAGREGDKLAVSATDYGLAGELMRQASEREAAESEVDDALSSRLRRILHANDFSAARASVYGNRRKHIFIGDIDLTATRLGSDDIRRLIEGVIGLPLSAPEFELDGAVLSMRLSSVDRFVCEAGMYACAASRIRRYLGERASGEAEDTVVAVTDDAPDGICGDGITSFMANGRQYMILSDGMGSGKEAALTSGVVVSLLERLIAAGAELETALKMLNGIIRATGRECAATVDIAEIDLMTGEARFIKSGAAPSFILRDGSIFRLQSKTVPIGIMRALDAEMIRFDIQAGDTVVMVSDGAARSYEEAPWLLDLMTDNELVVRGEPRAAAITIVSEAAIRGSEDDITAGVMRVTAA